MTIRSLIICPIFGYEKTIDEQIILTFTIILGTEIQNIIVPI